MTLGGPPAVTAAAEIRRFPSSGAGVLFADLREARCTCQAWGGGVCFDHPSPGSGNWPGTLGWQASDKNQLGFELDQGTLLPAVGASGRLAARTNPRNTLGTPLGIGGECSLPLDHLPVEARDPELPGPRGQPLSPQPCHEFQ